MNSQAQLSAAQQLASGGGSSGVPNLEGSSIDREPADDDDIPELEAVEEDGNVDETGVDPKDIELVIQQVGCTRAKAVRVLKESGGDLINASAYKCFLLSWTALLTSDLQSWPQASDLLYWVSLYSTSLLCPHVQNIPFGVPMTSPHLCDRVSQDFTEKITHRLQEITVSIDAVLRSSWTSPNHPGRSARRTPTQLLARPLASPFPPQPP